MIFYGWILSLVTETWTLPNGVKMRNIFDNPHFASPVLALRFHSKGINIPVTLFVRHTYTERSMLGHSLFYGAGLSRACLRASSPSPKNVTWALLKSVTCLLSLYFHQKQHILWKFARIFFGGYVSLLQKVRQRPPLTGRSEKEQYIP